MATGSQIRTVWANSVWANAGITALTQKIYNYDVTTGSTKEVVKFYHNQEINFITYLVSRAQRLRLMGQIEQIFTVDIRYYRLVDTAGANFNAVLDMFETIDSLVISQLTGTWGSIVDSYLLQDGPPTVNEITLDGNQVWLGNYKYFGFKNI